FYYIRLEPYLVATAARHPDRAAALLALVETTQHNKHALVHGDVSPKNILVGPQGPVFLDAECAWYGDPAFDLAFCLNHLLLKCLWVPGARDRFLECFDALGSAYLGRYGGTVLERRAASLLPGLLLARVDGKSPVEYVTEAAQKERVRSVARALLLAPPATLAEVRTAWQES
ncbi:MAG: phosphotransferase family protein, partial [Burkholderiales bacterium]